MFSPWLSGPWSLVICHFYYLVICSNGFQPNSATRPSLLSPSLTCTLSVWKYLLFGESTKRMGSVITVDHNTKTIKRPLNPCKRSWPQLKRACSGNTRNTISENTRNTNSGRFRNTNLGNARNTNSNYNHQHHHRHHFDCCASVCTGCSAGLVTSVTQKRETCGRAGIGWWWWWWCWWL